ncbi:MAG: hypothetical protein ACW96U_11695 [Candidatus Heimdallarchaeaceae archaeon]|jgi:hypothetical protein
MDELSKRIEKTVAEYNKEQERKKAEEELDDFRKILPEIDIKPKKTGLELLTETAQTILGRERLESKTDFFSHMTGNYRNNGAYTVNCGDFEISFDFEYRDKPPEKERIEDDIKEHIREMKLQRTGHRFALVKLEDVAEWAKEEFDDKIAVGDFNWRDDYYPNNGVFRWYYLADKEETLNWVKKHDKKFTKGLYGNSEYSLKTPLTSFTYPVMSGWRGRDWTGLIKRTSEYKSLVADLKPGKLEEMTVLTNKVDEAISERMDDYNHLFSYWKELTKELDELSHEHSRREKEYKEKFYKPSRF